MRFESLDRHPCCRPGTNPREMWHRSGGFGGTCERCGTSFVDGDVNKGTTGSLKWERVVPPKPFEPGSLERLLYDGLVGSNAPLHNGWRENLAVQLAGIVREAQKKE